jgi:hypothetical protein
VSIGPGRQWGMSAMRIVLLLLALAAVAFTAKYVLTGSVTGPEEKVQPAEQLQNVRDRAKELEGELQRAADRAEQQTKGAEP